MSLDLLLARMDRIRTADALVVAEREGLRRLYAARLSELIPVGTRIDLHPERLLGLPRGLRALLFGMQVSPSVRAAVFTTTGPVRCSLQPSALDLLWGVSAWPEMKSRAASVELHGRGLDARAVEFLGGRGKPTVETLSRWLDGEDR